MNTPICNTCKHRTSYITSNKTLTECYLRYATNGYPIEGCSITKAPHPFSYYFDLLQKKPMTSEILKYNPIGETEYLYLIEAVTNRADHIYIVLVVDEHEPKIKGFSYDKTKMETCFMSNSKYTR